MITQGIEKGLFGKKNLSENEIVDRINKYIFVNYFNFFFNSLTFYSIFKPKLKALLDKFINFLKEESFPKEFLLFIGSSFSENEVIQ